MKGVWKKLLVILCFGLWMGNGMQAEASSESSGFYEDGDIVGFIGDSITHVTYRSMGYVEMLEQYYLSRFPERNVEFRNLGGDGYKIRDVLNIYDSDPALRGMNKAVIMLGTNEAILKISPEEYIGNMEELIGRLKADGLESEDILIMSPPICDQDCAVNIDKNGYRRWAFEDRVLEYIDRLEERVHEWGVGYLDIHTPMAELTEMIQKEDARNTLTTDCIHPNAIGHRLITYYILQAQGADDGPLSEIIVPEEGEVQGSRGSLADYFRGDKGVRWTLEPGVLPVAGAEDVLDFQAFFEAGSILYGESLRVEGFEEDVSYRVLMGEVELGSFTGKELEEGIDLATLSGHPQQEAMEQINALSKKRHRETVNYRNMWVDVMMQRAAFTREEIAARYEKWRAADEKLRNEMHEIAEGMADDVFHMAVIEEGYSMEELEQAAEDARIEEERLRKEAEEQARKEEEERIKKEAEEQARRKAEEQRREEEQEQARREAEEAARQQAARETLMRKRAVGVGGGAIVLILIVLGIRRKRAADEERRIREKRSDDRKAV